MKKKMRINLAFGFGLCILAVSNAIPAIVQADTKDSQATFSLVSPENSMLLKTIPTLDFANQMISEQDSVYPATQSGTLSIADLTGSNNGWIVTVKVGEFQDTQDGTKKLVGASLFYPATEPTTKNSDTTLTGEPTVQAPDKDDVQQNGLRIAAGGSDTMLIKADKGTGNGLWDFLYDTQKVQLEVPVGQLAGTYQATVTYTLADVPQ